MMTLLGCPWLEEILDISLINLFASTSAFLSFVPENKYQRANHLTSFLVVMSQCSILEAVEPKASLEITYIIGQQMELRMRMSWKGVRRRGRAAQPFSTFQVIPHLPNKFRSWFSGIIKSVSSILHCFNM
jgi:hypothetical protein